MTQLSRREFLKLTGSLLGGMVLTPFLPRLTDFDDSNLVRVAIESVSIYKEPSDESAIVGQWRRDELVHVYEEVVAEEPSYNPVWYRVWGGFMHRARLPRVRVRYNTPLNAVRETGQIAEVTVPYTQSVRLVRGEWQPFYRLYYESTHWVMGVEPGPDGQPWYKLLDELLEINYYVPAIHMRPIPDEEIAPISPEVPFEKKRIEVDLRAQTLMAYEYDQVVFATKISSGLLYSLPGVSIPTKTPSGRFNIENKYPSKHMGDGSLEASIDAYELAGVPWTCFFTEQGHAFHGTWWHDNYGVPMSHGCINMRTPEAKWLFRWARPESVPDKIDVIGYGTMVHIF